MKSRTWFFILIALLILFFGLALFTYSARNPETAPVLPAAINRDCAPWDGAAFTVSIRYDLTSFIDISIWQAPDISIPVTFRFPDLSGRVGNAVYRPQFGEPEQLTGTVFFRRVGEEGPVEGGFDFERGDGMQFKGKFKAGWGSQIALCG